MIEHAESKARIDRLCEVRRERHEPEPGNAIDAAHAEFADVPRESSTRLPEAARALHGCAEAIGGFRRRDKVRAVARVMQRKPFGRDRDRSSCRSVSEASDDGQRIADCVRHQDLDRAGCRRWRIHKQEVRGQADRRLERGGRGEPVGIPCERLTRRRREQLRLAQCPAARVDCAQQEIRIEVAVRGRAQLHVAGVRRAVRTIEEDLVDHPLRLRVVAIAHIDRGCALGIGWCRVRLGRESARGPLQALAVERGARHSRSARPRKSIEVDPIAVRVVGPQRDRAACDVELRDGTIPRESDFRIERATAQQPRGSLCPVRAFGGTERDGVVAHRTERTGHFQMQLRVARLPRCGGHEFDELRIHIAGASGPADLVDTDRGHIGKRGRRKCAERCDGQTDHCQGAAQRDRGHRGGSRGMDSGLGSRAGAPRERIVSYMEMVSQGHNGIRVRQVVT